MRLCALGSGSRGNAFLLTQDGDALLVDAGFGVRELLRRIALAGLACDRLAGVVVTHEHGDHASGALAIARRFGCPVLTAGGTWAALGAPDDIPHVPLACAQPVAHAGFRVEACPTSHDAAEPIAVAVHGACGASVAFAYDLGRPTTAVRYLLRGRSALVLEANHDEMLLRTSSYPPSVQHRIAGSGGHLSNRAAAELLAEAAHPGLSAVLLAHLSERCNDAQTALAAAGAALRRGGFRGRLDVIPQDRPLPPLDLAPPAGAQFALPF